MDTEFAILIFANAEMLQYLLLRQLGAELHLDHIIDLNHFLLE